MVKRSRQKFAKRFNFLLTETMQADIYRIVDLTGEDAAEIVRRMIARELPVFLAYASEHRSIPPIETQAA